MRVLIKYVASSGHEYNLKADGIKIKTANFHAWSWGVESTALQFGERIANFKRDSAVYETTLYFSGSYTERKALIDALHEDFEIDIRRKTPGRVIWGDYYIDCYVLESSTEPTDGNVWTANTVQFYCPHPFWIREVKRQFFAQGAPQGEVFLDYPYDYEYDYAYGDVGIANWDTGIPFDSDFTMTIYGPVSDPLVVINGHTYQIHDTLAASEWVTIDSRENTVIKTLANGTKISVFDLRNKSQSVFEKIPAGKLIFNWSGIFGFDLTLYEERSEPRATIGGAA